MEEPKHLLDIIRRTKPKAALFGTYTFSVSYFDAVFVPVLRSVGCERIDVLVDATKAATSCEEHLSRAAGRVYRIVPVRVPSGGIFHPKVTYLAGPEDDVLSIGSGNLTASGQSLQLECIDAVTASGYPGLFSEFADWLQLVADKVGANSAAAAILMKYHERAMTKGKQAVPAAAPARSRLIHPLVGTPRAVLASYFRELFPTTNARSLLVLSPFHAPDAKPVLGFAKDIAASRIDVGLDGRRLNAPFQRNLVRGKKLNFVVPEGRENRKPLHAKVFEIRTATASIVMTGSINATNQSFDSRRNIELSLARLLKTSSFQWRDVEPIGWEPTTELSFEEDRQRLWVEAWLETSSELHGRMRADFEVQDARLELSVGGRVVFSAQVTVEADGQFCTEPIRELDTGSSYVLRVAAHSLEASCWVNLLEELELATEERERKSAVQRVLRGEYDFNDVAHIIHLLSMVADGTTGVARGRQASRAHEAADLGESVFDLDAWEFSGKFSSGSTSLSRFPQELLRALNKWIAKDMEQRDAPKDRPVDQHQPTLTGGTDEQAKEASSAKSIDLEQLIDTLCVAIPTALERGLRSDHAVILIEVAAARALQRSRKYRIEMSPCVSWLHRFSRFTFDESTRPRMLEVACAMAAVTAWGFEDETGKPAPLSLLREGIEQIAKCRLQASDIELFTSKGLDYDTFAMLSAQKPWLMQSALQIAVARSVDDDLIAMLCELRVTGGSSHLADQYQTDVALAFRARRPVGEELARGVLDDRLLEHGGCPICGLKLGSDEISSLRRSHVLLHRMGCKKLIFYSNRAPELRTALIGLSHAQ